MLSSCSTCENADCTSWSFSTSKTSYSVWFIRMSLGSPSKHVGENEWCNDGCVRFNNVFWGVHTKLAPRDFLIWHRAAITSIAGRGIADLAKVTPERNIFP